MANRRPIVGGNWKMNLHHDEAAALTEQLAKSIDGSTDSVDVFICPAFPYLHKVYGVLKDSHSQIKLAAQDFYHQPNGAFTGEVSLSMLKDVGVGVVLVGHSERRHVIGEGDVLVNNKVLAALDANMDVVLCIGEKLEQREAGQTNAINAAQLAYGLAGVSAEQLEKVTIAYEPVWAIGTGKTATPEDAQAAHSFIRGVVTGMYNFEAGEAIRIQYGGSVKGSNAAELFTQPDIDGGLIGGASLKVDDFTTIIKAAAAVPV